jgi:hypothetical protein
MTPSPTEPIPAAAPPVTPAVPLDYGHEDHVGDFSRRVSAGAAERVDGFFQFIGMLIAMLVSLRQIIFAIGLALLANGLGHLMALNPSAAGLSAITIGAGLIGLCIPLPRNKA